MRGSAGRETADQPRRTSAGEDAPLGAVDPAGVVGEDELQGVGHALVGGAQGRQGHGLAEDDPRVAGGGGHGGSPEGFDEGGDFERVKDAR